MKRREFLKTAGLAGFCSCFVARTMAKDLSPAAAAEDWRIAFAHQRYSKLVSLLSQNVDAPTFEKILREVGSFCSDNGFAKNFSGNLEGCMEEMRKRWGAIVTHDREHNTVTVSFAPPNQDCACPLMSKNSVPAAACACSLGSLRRTFATATGRNTQTILVESMLQGGTRCTIRVQLS